MKFKSFLVLFFVLVPFLLMSLTLDESKAKAIKLVEDGAAYIKANGIEKSKAEVNNPKGKFVDGEFYLFLFNMKLETIMHGQNPALIGKNMMEAKDPDGKLFIQEFAKVCNSKAGKGWVDYKWMNYADKKIGDKSSYVMKIKVGKEDYILGCGIYK